MHVAFNSCSFMYLLKEPVFSALLLFHALSGLLQLLVSLMLPNPALIWTVKATNQAKKKKPLRFEHWLHTWLKITHKIKNWTKMKWEQHDEAWHSINQILSAAYISLTYPKEVLDNVAYRVARSIVGFWVLCDWFSHDMSHSGIRGRRAVVYFGPACF